MSNEKTYPSYPSLYTLGHAHLRDMFTDDAEIIVEEKVDGCVSPDTLILKSDLTYAKAGDLRVGDALLGFDENLNNPRLCETIVTASQTIRKDVARVIFSDGRSVVASLDHPWLVRQKTNNNGKRWVTTKDLTPGVSRVVAMPTWSPDPSWEAGWVAGMFDGEGSLVRSGNQRILSVYQRVGPTLNQLITILATRGFNFNLDTRRRKPEYTIAGALVLRGGTWTEILRFLGTFRPARLLADVRKIWEESPLNYVPDVTVVSVEPLGEGDVQGLSTSSKTYIANGLFSHNSQFSFGVVNGELQCRSKRCILSDPIPDLFRGAVTTAKTLFDEGKLTEGWVYRGEAIQRPKHNTLCYDRTPNYFIAIYDIMIGLEDYMGYDDKKMVCDSIGLECVPLLYRGPISGVAAFKDLLDRKSFLGGCKIEGIVIKNHARFGYDKKPLIAKLVSDEFKEVHNGDWKDRNPKNGDIILKLVEKYRTPARWAKAMQHLRDDGTLTNSPKDIGPIIVECQADIRKECEDDIKKELFDWAWKQIAHKLVGGLPQWYKDQLIEEIV